MQDKFECVSSFLSFYLIFHFFFFYILFLAIVFWECVFYKERRKFPVFQNCSQNKKTQFLCDVQKVCVFFLFVFYFFMFTLFFGQGHLNETKSITANNLFFFLFYFFIFHSLVSYTFYECMGLRCTFWLSFVLYVI